MGTITLKFDGTSVTAYDNGSAVKSWYAISGNILMGGLEFLNPKNTNQPHMGPLPEGHYTVDPSKKQNISDISDSDYFWGLPHKGPFPFNETAWGHSRIELTPNAGTEMYGRKDFFIHGGKFPGSAGCLDLMDESDFMDFISSVGTPVTLEVHYPLGFTGADHPFLNPAHNYPYTIDDYRKSILEDAADRFGADVTDFSGWVPTLPVEYLLDLIPGHLASLVGMQNGNGGVMFPAGNGGGAEPLVLDLNGDGAHASRLGYGAGQRSHTYFDMDNDGFAERTAWATGGDGLLALDKNGNGKIDNQGELFGNTATYANGFLNLKPLALAGI